MPSVSFFFLGGGGGGGITRDHSLSQKGIINHLYMAVSENFATCVPEQLHPIRGNPKWQYTQGPQDSRGKFP